MSNSPTKSANDNRFAFGKNWARFLKTIDEGRIQSAIDDLVTMLEVDSLAGRTFLDIGCGSGLMSLAARRLGAAVHSFDYDTDCVNCARELRRRYFPNDGQWSIEQGSALDRPYLESLGSFDIVYSWGVLHHTGQMWEALNNACLPVEANGQLFVSIYNDQGGRSRAWRVVKRAYCHAPRIVQPMIVAAIAILFEGKSFAKACAFGKPLAWVQQRCSGRKTRGMSRWRDWVDWVGGYPFEVAKPEEVFSFYRRRGFQLRQLTTANGGLGCNSFVFQCEAGFQPAVLDRNSAA